MLKTDVLNHFKTASNVARALDISPAAVSKWGAVVPYHSAREIERITFGAVPFHDEMYVRGKPIQQSALPSQAA